MNIHSAVPGFFLFSAIILSSLTSICLEEKTGDIRPLGINQAPEGMTEVPFQETNPELQPADKEKKQGFILFSRPITEPVYPQTNPLPSERISSLSGFGTQGEFEPLNFVIYPLKKLENLRVSVSELRSGNNVIPEKNLDIRLVTYRNILYPNYRSKDTYRKMPELLEKVTVCTAPEKEPQRYWLKIRIPEDSPSGIYTGTFRITCDGLAEPELIPIFFKVFPFKLESDPSKNYTAYNIDIHINIDDSHNIMRDLAKEKGREWIYQAAKNDYASMRDYGFTCFPTLWLRYDSKSGKFYIPGGEEAVADIIQAGMKAPIPIMGGVDDFYYSFMNKRLGSHCKVPEMPPEEFYKQLSGKIKIFEDECKRKNWPEQIYVPLDEVDASAREFGVKVYKAFKEAGTKTFITKDPKSADAKDYEKYVDNWCSQPFSVPYDEVASSVQAGYWCYPNHNSFEIKDPLVMCRGGRMTYGFGLWRSGYTLLIPWTWRSSRTDYLKIGSAGGNRIAEDGSTIPAVYWEAFREGIDDAKYIYTLQKAIVNREDSGDKDCLKLVKEGRKLIQEIWDNIPVQTKYLANNVWNPREFDGYRWQMAKMIEKLLKYPASNNNPIPSVLADHKAEEKQISTAEFLRKQFEAGNLEVLDLGSDNYKNWISVCTEAKISVSEKIRRNNINTLLFDVTVNQKVDGGGENGKYPIGWPRMVVRFDKGNIDLTEYDYITLWVMVDSNRDEVADDFSPFYISIKNKTKNLYYVKDIINEVDQRVWIPVVLSIRDMQKDTNSPHDSWKHVNGIQFGISESKYTDGTNLKFYLDDISLVKFKTPAILSTDMPSTLILPAETMPFAVSLLGSAACSKDRRYAIHASLFDEKDAKATETSNKNIEGNTNLSINTSLLKPGKYTMRLEIKDQENRVYSTLEKKLNILDGPLMKN